MRTLMTIVIVLGGLFPLLANADESTAVAYLKNACADGFEHLIAYDPQASEVVDLTVGSSNVTVRYDDVQLMGLYNRDTLRFYHCHTIVDIMAQFPSGSEDGRLGDYGSAAELQFQLVLHATVMGVQPPTVTHAIVAPGGRIVPYGFSETMTAGIVALGEDAGSLFKTDDLPGYRAVRENAQDLFARLNRSYFDSFIRFAENNCTVENLATCEALTVKNFMEPRQSDDWWIKDAK